MKYITRILIFCLCIIGLSSIQITNVSADGFKIEVSEKTVGNNLDTRGIGSDKNSKAKNTKLDKFKDDKFYNTNKTGIVGAKNTLFNVAKSLKNLFFILASIYLMFLVYKLLFADKSEEEASKFKSGIIWTILGIIIMQIAYIFVTTLYGKTGIGGGLANVLLENAVYPFIGLLQGLAGMIFIVMAIFAFYQLVTANGDEERVKKGKMSILYSLAGVALIIISKNIIESIYGKIKCKGTNFLISNSCVRETDLGATAQIIVRVIDWINGFIGLAVVLLIIYAGAKIIFANGNPDELDKAKKSIVYIAIGVLILITSYIIVTFFIGPNKII